MRNKRLITIAVIIISLLVTVEPAFAAPFSDTERHWASENINLLASKGIVSGYGDGTFKPNSHVTVSEFISMVVKALGIENKSPSKKKLNDDIVNSALKYRIIVAGEFDRYDRPIRRGEMAVIIVRALGLKPVSQKTAFKDDNDIPRNIKGYIAEAANNEIITGLPDGTFNAKRKSTRAEAATMIVKMLDYIYENSGNENRKPVEQLIKNVSALGAENIKYAKILTLSEIKEKGYTFSKYENNEGKFVTTNFSGVLAYIKRGRVIGKNNPSPMEETSTEGTYCFPIKIKYDGFDYLALYNHGEETVELISNPFIDSAIDFTAIEKEAAAEELEEKPKEPEVKPSPVYATVKLDANLYASNTTYSEVIGFVPAGAEVEVIQDRSYKWYNIEYNGKKGWVTSDVLLIPEDPETNSVRLTKEEMETFVNNKGFSSSTEYFVWVDIDRQLVNIFKGSKGNWVHLKSIVCATGKNKSPTIRGTFTIQDRGKWFYNDVLKSGAMYWVRFYGPYLFHSVAMDSNQRITDDTLGKRASAGCVRMSLKDSAWFYENIPAGTTVWIY